MNKSRAGLSCHGAHGLVRVTDMNPGESNIRCQKASEDFEEVTQGPPSEECREVNWTSGEAWRQRARREKKRMFAEYYVLHHLPGLSDYNSLILCCGYPVLQMRGN